MGSILLFLLMDKLDQVRRIPCLVKDLIPCIKKVMKPKNCLEIKILYLLKIIPDLVLKVKSQLKTSEKLIIMKKGELFLE